MNDNKIREKLAKMLTLASDGNASKGEIENALAMATQMMVKYNLTRDDIDLSQADPIKNVKYATNNAWTLSGKVYAWELALSQFICKFMGTTKHYLNHGRFTKRPNGIVEFDGDGNPMATRMVTFYGAEEDCEIAVSLYHELQKAIQLAAIVRYGKWAKGDGGVYCEGFVQGLNDANIREIAKLKNCDNQTNALILVSEKTQLAIVKGAEDWLIKSKGIKLRKGQGSSGASGSGNARAEGRNDGSKYGLEKRGATKKIA
jgi:Protein of unknown function (DUF2786)